MNKYNNIQEGTYHPEQKYSETVAGSSPAFTDSTDVPARQVLDSVEPQRLPGGMIEAELASNQ